MTALDVDYKMAASSWVLTKWAYFEGMSEGGRQEGHTRNNQLSWVLKRTKQITWTHEPKNNRPCLALPMERVRKRERGNKERKGEREILWVLAVGGLIISSSASYQRKDRAACLFICTIKIASKAFLSFSSPVLQQNCQLCTTQDGV